MRRSVLLATLAGLAGCGTRRTDAGAPRARPATGAPVRIVVLGDSLALGTGASSPAKGFVFRAFLRVREAHPASRVDNVAMGGATAADVLRVQVPRLVQERADVVVVCAGGNDVVRRVAPQAFAAVYARIAARVRALQPHAVLVLCGVPDVGASPLFTGFDHDGVSRLARTDDAAVRDVARRAGASFVDLHAVTVRSKRDVARFLSDDRFHPSDVGHAAFADALAPALLRAAASRRP
ncbi:MAG: SGNH/GDSL hydrolase family protein [Candidatus Elarobacter sp.]